MDIDLEELKRRYRKKTRVNIVDLNQLQIMVPMLIREVCRLEDELKENEKYITQLEKRRPPNQKSGRSGKAKWEVNYDVKKNRMKICLEGTFDYRASKMASNAVVMVLSNARKDFDVISDIRKIDAITNIKTVFHLRKVIYNLGQSGVNRIVRIPEPKNKLITSVFEKNFIIERKKAYIATSMEEAETILDNDGRFLKP